MTHILRTWVQKSTLLLQNRSHTEVLKKDTFFGKIRNQIAPPPPPPPPPPPRDYYIQCRHLIPALNEWAARVKYTTARLYATQFLGHGYVCMTSQLNVALMRRLRGSLMCLASLLTCYPWSFVQPGTGRRLVDWCRK